MLKLKPISAETIPSALEKAVRYRLLNEPREAESICRDILRIEPEYQPGLVGLVLALTDQFGKGFGVDLGQVQELLPKLTDEYEQAYYAGVILERWGKGQLARGTPRHVVGEWLRSAMRCYDKAETIRPAGNDDAILRWNACARIIRQETLPVQDVPPASLAGFNEGFDDEVPVL